MNPRVSSYLGTIDVFIHYVTIEMQFGDVLPMRLLFYLGSAPTKLRKCQIERQCPCKKLDFYDDDMGTVIDFNMYML